MLHTILLGCKTCKVCSTVTGKEPLTLNNHVSLQVDDLGWFCKSEEAVLTCTAPGPGNTSIVWRHKNNMIGFDAKPLNESLYHLSSYSNSTMRQDKLRVSSSIALYSVRELSAFHCEIPGYSSRAIHLFILGNILK